MADETLHNLFAQVFASGWVRNSLNIVWHAGEPMVLPIEFYRRAFRTIGELRPRDVEVRHSFQTNGTLIDDRWCEFFADERVKVGVSIDGPKHFHDRNRLTRSGRGTFDRTIAGVRLLRKHELPFHVISVLTAESMAAPQEMFDFYLAERIDQVCFNVEESEGDHRSQSFAQIGVEDAYYRFLAEFWRLAAGIPDKFTLIREIEEAAFRVLRPKETAVTNQLTTPFAMLNIDWTGNVATFSPELLGLKNAEYDDFILGNVNRDTLTELPQRPLFRKMLADIDAGIALCRERCEYFSVCGGGEPINKLSENGSFISTETTYCRMTRMRATDLVLDLLERVPERVVTGAAALSARMLTAADAVKVMV